MGKLSQEDLKLIVLLKAEGVLVPVNPDKIKLEQGVILTSCSDGDQMPDIFTYHLNMSLGQGLQPRIHLVALNGGGLLIPTQSQLVQDHHEDVILLKHIADACKLKGINTVLLYAHAPCGAAGLAGLTLEQVFGLHVQAVKLLRALPDLQVISLFHIDDGRYKRSWFFNTAKWESRK